MNTSGGWIEEEPSDALERLALGLCCLGSGLMSYQGRCPKCGRAFGPGEMPDHGVVDLGWVNRGYRRAQKPGRWTKRRE